MNVTKMKFKLIFLVFQFVHIITSSTEEPPDESLNPDLTFYRISELIGAHHRLTVGFNLLADLIKPSPTDAFAGFANVDTETITDIATVDLEEPVRELKNINTEGLNVTNSLKTLDSMKKALEFLDNPPNLSTENMKKEAGDMIYGWMIYSEANLTTIERYYADITEIDNFEAFLYTDSIIAAINTPAVLKINEISTRVQGALQNFPIEMKSKIRQLRRLTVGKVFEEVFLPIKIIFDSLETQTKLLMEPQEISQISKIISTASRFKESASLIESIATLSNYENSMIRGFFSIGQLRGDLKSEYLKGPLADGNELTRLIKILDPVFKFHHFFILQYTSVFPEFGDESIKLDSLMRKLPDFSFDDAIKNVLEISKIPVESIQKFSQLFKSLTDGLDAYQRISKDLDEFENSHLFKMTSNVSSFVSKVSDAAGKSIQTKNAEIWNTLKSDESFLDLKSDYKEVIDEMKKFNENARKVHSNFQNLKDWRKIIMESEQWIKTNLAGILKKLKEEKVAESVESVKSSLEFVEIHQSISKEEFENFLKRFQEMKEKVKDCLEKTSEKSESLKHLKDAPWYKYVALFREHVDLADKLKSGEILFKLFDQFLKEEEKFEEVFRLKNKIGKKIEESISYADKSRYEIVSDLIKLNSTEEKIKKMSSEIKIQKSRYDGIPNEELIDLRWLVENLEDITNPEYRTSDWTEFSKTLPDGFEKQEFEKAIQSTFDLDFANHQESVRDTFKNLRALVNLHLNLLGTEDEPKVVFEF